MHAYKTVDVASLKPAKVNPRTHSPAQIEQLRRSIREFGFTNPLLIDENLQLIAGHGRLAAAIAEGMDQLPAIEVAGLTAAQKRALVMADNQLGLNAGWDFALVRSELDALMADGFDLDITGFSRDQLTEFSGFVTP